jgi:hydrogenase maturation protease
VPSRIHVVAVEVADMETIGEGLSPAVAAAVPGAVAETRRAAAALGS